MLLSQLCTRPSVKQKVYLFGEERINNNSCGPSRQADQVVTSSSASRNVGRRGSALSPKIPHKKLKQEPKLVVSIQKRRSKLSFINKNNSLLDYQSYVDQNMEKSLPVQNYETMQRNLDRTLKKSQTISYQRTRQSLSPRCKGPRINYNLKLLIKNRRPSSLSHAKQYGKLLQAVRVM